jgi:hypothetical protein
VPYPRMSLRWAAASAILGALATGVAKFSDLFGLARVSVWLSMAVGLGCAEGVLILVSLKGNARDRQMAAYFRHLEWIEPNVTAAPEALASARSRRSSGQFPQAVVLATAAVEGYRVLAGEFPELFSWQLGQALFVKGDILSDLFRHQESILALQQAADLLRGKPYPYSRTARSVRKYLGPLTDPGPLPPARDLAGVWHQVDQQRYLKQANPASEAEQRHLLGACLHTLGLELTRADRPADALPVAAEALEVFRCLPAEQAAQANCLAVLLDAHEDVGNLAMACVLGAELIARYQDLTHDEPGQFDFDLAMTLGSHGATLLRLGEETNTPRRLNGAARVLGTAIDLLRISSDLTRDVSLANALINAARAAGNADDPARAQPLISEAVGLCREMNRLAAFKASYLGIPRPLHSERLVRALLTQREVFVALGQDAKAAETDSEIAACLRPDGV